MGLNCSGQSNTVGADALPSHSPHPGHLASSSLRNSASVAFCLSLRLRYQKASSSVCISTVMALQQRKEGHQRIGCAESKGGSRCLLLSGIFCDDGSSVIHVESLTISRLRENLPRQCVQSSHARRFIRRSFLETGSACRLASKAARPKSPTAPPLSDGIDVCNIRLAKASPHSSQLRHAPRTENPASAKFPDGVWLGRARLLSQVMLGTPSLLARRARGSLPWLCFPVAPHLDNHCLRCFSLSSASSALGSTSIP